MPFVPGETIGPYRLVEQLGQGGMATVYKAYHAALDRFVALKALHPAFLEDPNFLARFQREARLVAKLEHPNIVPIYDFAEHEGRPFLVMKYIEGQTLKAHLSTAPLSPADILLYAEAVGAALQYAHERGILHRDVKPSNVIIAADGGIFLADFGLARIAHGGTSTLTADMLVGTPQYISPEQAQSVPDIDARTDIYSFAVMLYEMYVGRVPYSADTPFSIIHDHIYTPLPLPRAVNPAVPAAVEHVLLKALAKNRTDRYPAVSEMIQALRRASAGTEPEPAGAAPASAAWAATAAFLAPASPPVESAATVISSKSASTPPAAPQAPKKKPSLWPWAFGLLLLTLVTVGLFGGLMKTRQERLAADSAAATATGAAVNAQVATETSTRLTATSAPREPGEPPALSPFGLPQPAQEMLDYALEQWRNANSAEAYAGVVKAIDSLEDNPAYTTAAVNYSAKNDAWMLAAMIAGDYYRRHPSEFTPEQLQLLHEALYRAAGAQGGQEFFEDFKQSPLFVVAGMRRELYFGAGPAAVKDELGRFMGQPLNLRRFPEARLLEAELFYQQGDLARARELLDKLLKDQSLPEWVRVMAQEVQAKAK